ncbi:uncharacterized protein LOC124915782 isoform X2 [Impatiens glandulifera]|uniref:uncharacterized protein LOC124915782 isoform X2 n=1 Tax=Impatiens glandulifera TaxID=253017 RepID=UPI001FB05D52|nr:uncharacterized protein LOC124915782 isoform X2 [Impatiens glandulifera]
MKQSVNQFFTRRNFSLEFFKREDDYKKMFYNVLIRHHSHESDGEKEEKRYTFPVPGNHNRRKEIHGSGIHHYSSDEDDNKWKKEHEWVAKALEPALKFYRRTLQTGNETERKTVPVGRSMVEIISDIQRSKLGLPDWKLSDLTIGLYLMYLQQQSTYPLNDVNGIQITSDSIVHDLIYHVELAKGAYRGNANNLAKVSMLQEDHIVKFVKDSSVMRPGYFIGIDLRRQLVVLGIRGTNTVYDFVTDIVSSSSEEITYEGYSSHFGSAEAARWFLNHEMGTIKWYLDKHQGFRLRIVGHSLGAATASLLAIMIRRKTTEELGFDPKIVTAVGVATPPCVSRELAECSSDFITSVVMQDDIVPRLSVASLNRLRNEVLQTDWMTVLEKEDWRSAKDLVINAKQVVLSVQDVAKKLANLSMFRSQKIPNNASGVSLTPPKQTEENDTIIGRNEESVGKVPELFVPGTLYYLKKRNSKETKGDNSCKSKDGKGSFTLLKAHPGQHFPRIVLSSNIILDHRCDSHLYALRDVIKNLPGIIKECIY